MKEISVIIPTYNRAKTIKYCLESILCQTYQNFEIIIVDDCSTDNTVDIVKKIQDNRIRIIILNKNSGAQVARNRGIKEAKYEWIAFQDSDDEWLPNKLEKQINELKKVNYAPLYVVHGNCYIQYSKKDKKIWELPKINGSGKFKILLNIQGPMFQAILTSKKALEKIEYLDDNVPSYQEWDTSIRLAQYCNFIHIKEPLFIYHFHKGETISKNKLQDIMGYQYIISKFQKDIIELLGNKAFENHLHNQTQKILNWKILDIIFKSKPIYMDSLKEYIQKTFEKDFGYYQKYHQLTKSKKYKLYSFILKPFTKLRYVKKNIT